MRGSGGHVWLGVCMAGGCVWQGGMHGRVGGHVWQRGVCGGRACMAEKTAIAAGSTHPTGMHSCSSGHISMFDQQLK